jgi:Domain of unknown function (DUF3395)
MLCNVSDRIDGLVILEGRYGSLRALKSVISAGGAEQSGVMDVTIACQALVHNSQLTIPGGRSKVRLFPHNSMYAFQAGSVCVPRGSIRRLLAMKSLEWNGILVFTLSLFDSVLFSLLLTFPITRGYIPLLPFILDFAGAPCWVLRSMLRGTKVVVDSILFQGQGAHGRGWGSCATKSASPRYDRTSFM